MLAPEVLVGAGDADDEINETIDHPAKVMRIGTMLKQLLAEVRSTELDEASRQRLREIYGTSVTEVGSALSGDLRDELARLASPFEQPEAPSATELQIAKAQLVGWLEGLHPGHEGHADGPSRCPHTSSSSRCGASSPPAPTPIRAPTPTPRPAPAPTSRSGQGPRAGRTRRATTRALVNPTMVRITLVCFVPRVFHSRSTGARRG